MLQDLTFRQYAIVDNFRPFIHLLHSDCGKKLANGKKIIRRITSREVDFSEISKYECYLY